MKNIKLVISYEGTRYLGWQKTAMGPSIEEQLEKALKQPVQLQAASRTDAGVHAKGQVINFFSNELPYTVNDHLPKDISVVSMEEVPADFHATLSSRGKEYEYHLCLGQAQLPFHLPFSWHFPYPLDLTTMMKAASLLKGEHDFSAFTNEKQENNMRCISDISLETLPDHRLKIRVAGNNFLYKMVRNIVGTLVYVGCGKLAWQDIPPILESRARARAGVTAPAHGLTLNQVFYAAE